MNFLNYRILNVAVKTLIKRCTIASVCGLGCGQCVHNLKEHPGSAEKFIKYAAVGGLVGGLRGYFVGLWMGSGAVTLFLSQTMFASCITFSFFSIRSSISNEKFTLVWRGEPINEILVTSVSGGITMAGISMLSGMHPRRMLTSLSVGMIFGFLGHLVYEQAQILRLEFLLKQNYPDLISQLQDAEDYMDEQQYANPNYTGPIRASPWSDFAKSIWFDFGQTEEKILEDNAADLMK